MECRNYARVAVNLKAALISDQAIPIDCRVRDVSTGGMLLQYQCHDKTTTFHEGDTVKVRIAFRQGDERNVIPLPMTVRHVEENGIGAEFLQPQSELMQQVNPYRLDKEDTKETAANQVRTAISASSSTRASRRKSAIKRARVQFEDSMKTAQAPASVKKQPDLGQMSGGDDVTGKGSRKLFYIGLLSLVTAVGVLLLNFADNTRFENRMSAMESTTNRLVNALTLLRARTSSTATRTNELAELNARVDTLTASFAALMISTPDAHQPQPAAPAQPQNTNPGGPWVINLLSLHNKTEANQFTEKARAQGIRADTIEVKVKGRQVWRVLVSGFATRDEASAYGDSSKEKLGLNNVWVFKK